MSDWKIFAGGALLLWGIWGFIGKFAAKDLSPKQLLAYSVCGFACTVPLVLWWAGRELLQCSNGRAMTLAFITGAVSAGASLCYYLAITKGDVSRIVVVTSVYPVVTCLLSVIFLGERLTLSEIGGITLCIGGVMLLAR